MADPKESIPSIAYALEGVVNEKKPKLNQANFLLKS